MMGGNAFYSNAEAYALEILQQKLMKEAQKSAQQTMMELSAMRSFLGHGQLLYCIPFGGGPLPGSPALHPCCPFPHLPPADVPRLPPLPPVPPQGVPPPPPPPPPPPGNHSPCQGQQQSMVRVNVKNPHVKIPSHKPGADECKLGKEGIEVTIDLREYLPADISLDVEEKSVEVKACHVDSHGSRTFARRYDLPACITLDSVRCVLSHEGFLMFSASWCKME